MAAGDTVKCARFWTMVRSKQLACQGCVNAPIQSNPTSGRLRVVTAGRPAAARAHHRARVQGAAQGSPGGASMNTPSQVRPSKIDGRQKKNRRRLTRWARSRYG
jgi:hypothetical protein